jgi:hypothetical protein
MKTVYIIIGIIILIALAYYVSNSRSMNSMTITKEGQSVTTKDGVIITLNSIDMPKAPSAPGDRPSFNLTVKVGEKLEGIRFDPNNSGKPITVLGHTLTLTKGASDNSITVGQ